MSEKSEQDAPLDSTHTHALSQTGILSGNAAAELSDAAANEKVPKICCDMLQQVFQRHGTRHTTYDCSLKDLGDAFGMGPAAKRVKNDADEQYKGIQASYKNKWSEFVAV